MGQKVLIVDDDPIVHRVLRHYLERIGYEIISATNGRQAIELATSQLPQLIILDVRMPEMGGLGRSSRAQRNADHQADPGDYRHSPRRSYDAHGI